MRITILALLAMQSVAQDSCSTGTPTSDSKQRDAQEKILMEGTAQVGMPAITHFTERKLMKDILELRDQAGLVTYAYTFSEVTGKLIFFCNSIGYGLPYATQFTNPEKVAYAEHQVGVITLPQADPNGLFSPSSADGTWVMCKDPNGSKVAPVFVEPKVVVSPFKLEP